MWSYQPLSGDGAKKHGGRFNRPGKSALYTSLDTTTTWMEAQQAFPFKPQPMTLVAYQVDCADLVDLTQPKTLALLNLKKSDVACAWEDISSRGQEPLTWQLADRLQAMGFFGVIVQSFAPGCTEDNRNLVKWGWLSHCITVIDDLGRLPKSSESWKTQT